MLPKSTKFLKNIPYSCRRDRNINTGRQHHHHHGSSGLVKSGDETDDGGGLLSVLAPGPCCVSGHQCLVTLVSVSAVLVALVMVYTITSLNTRVASLEQQLRSGDNIHQSTKIANKNKLKDILQFLLLQLLTFEMLILQDEGSR